MFNIIIHESSYDQGILDAIKGKSSIKEKIVGTTTTFSEGLIFLKENYPNAFIRNQYIIRRK